MRGNCLFTEGEIYPITDEDNYGTLFTRAYDGCADVLYRAIKKIQCGEVNPIKQHDIDPIGMYCGMRVPGDTILEVLEYTYSGEVRIGDRLKSHE